MLSFHSIQRALRASRRTVLHGRFGGAALFCVLAVLVAAPLRAAEQADWSLLHITDVHIDPQPAGAAPTTIRGDATLKWIAEAVAVPQEVGPLNLTAPSPTLALVTGDITEFGAIGDTWLRVEEVIGRIPAKPHYLPGNHDNTWNSIYGILRRVHGGVNHAFDLGGVRFLCISSASPQEPVPTVDATTRSWLRAEFAKAGPAMPIIVALHHAPHIDEYANPAEMATLIDMLRDYNVVLFMYGHGHAVVTRDNGGIPGVMGGSTFGKNAGYGLLVAKGGKLSYAYRYHQGDPAEPNVPGPTWKKLYEREIPSQAPPRLLTITKPVVDAESCGDVLEVAWKPGEGAGSAKAPVIRIGADEAKIKSIDAERGVATIDTSALLAGVHLLTIAVTLDDGRSDMRARSFTKRGAKSAELWRLSLPAAVRAGPVFFGDQLVVCRTDGLVQALDPKTGRELWNFSTEGEIIGTPAAAGELLVVGSGDGGVYALDTRGQKRWRYDAGQPVYGWPIIADEAVYVGDNQGCMHAINAADGVKRWVFARAAFSIESQAVRWKDLLVFGAWDGHLYALDARTGEQRWKSLGAKASQSTAARYYSPADCPPVAIDGALFVADRGYVLGSYDVDGKLKQSWDIKAAGIAAGGGDQTLFVRATEGGVSQLSADGTVQWTRDVPAGRFPIPPTMHDGRVYVCSNRGRLSVLAASDGAVQWEHQATPGFYVMAPVAVRDIDGSAVAFVAGMDGTLVALRSN